MTIQVREGQCYAKILNNADCAMLWDVQSISAQFLSLPHARLVNHADIDEDVADTGG